MVGWLGAIALVAGGFGVGRLLTLPVRERGAALYEWQECLDRLQVEVDWRRRPLVEALGAAGHPSPALREVAQALRRALEHPGADLAQAVADALAADGRLAAEERHVLENLLCQLGRSGGQYHDALWEWARRELATTRSGVQEKARTEGRMLETLCTLAACALAIWLV
ncbi:MAG: stage III sporulation protein AB [Firmicutes bacterium]|nr:stage III sporulation protein AB [Bacillota bacterium]